MRNGYLLAGIWMIAGQFLIAALFGLAIYVEWTSDMLVIIAMAVALVVYNIVAISLFLKGLSIEKAVKF